MTMFRFLRDLFGLVAMMVVLYAWTLVGQLMVG